jgi:hypothetical protein
MTHFEAYRWEDHVPRAGSWKLNLSAGLLAFGLISAAFPDRPNDPAFYMSARAAAETRDPSVEISRDHPAVLASAVRQPVTCPARALDHTDS